MKDSRRKVVLGMGLVAATAPVYAQFGGLGGLVGGKASGGGGDVDSQVKGFLEKSIKIETTLNRALLAIVAAYAKDTDRAKYQARFQELGKQTDPKEAGAKFQETFQSAEADAKMLASSTDFENQTKQLTAEKQQQVAKGVVNFLLGALQAKDVIPMGQSIMQSVTANPMAIPKVIPIKDAVPRLTSAMSLAASTMPQFLKVLRGANIKVADVTASTKEEKLDSI